MQRSHRSWLGDQAYHLGRIVTAAIIVLGQQTTNGAKGLSRLARECAVEFLAGMHAQKGAMTNDQPKEV